MTAIDQPIIARVRWRTGLIGCLLPIMVGAFALFAFAAFDPSLLDELAQERRGALIGLMRGVTVGGVNIPLLILAIYLGWEVFRFAWRWADGTAATATASYLVPHRSTLLSPMAWDDIADVSFRHMGRAPTLVVTLRNGARKRIAGVDDSAGAAQSFAAHACHLASGA